MQRSYATDFFERQDQAKRNTLRLVLLFAVVFVFLAVGMYLVLAIALDVFGMLGGIDPVFMVMPLLSEEVTWQFHWELAVGAVATTAAFIFIGSASKVSSVKKGGAAVATELSATEVDASHRDPLVRRYVNVVEEIALASGVPVPRVFVLEDQPGINAFAAGFTTNDAAIAITQGALRQLRRDELQGVIAHEFSHILNGDMRLNIRLIGVLHGIMGIYVAGQTLWNAAWASWGNAGGRRSLTRGRAEAQATFLAIPGVALMAFGFAGVVGSRMIKSGIVRQREYLADAAAIQFTRNPGGLVGALKKIGGFEHGSRLQGAKAEMVSHMCFGGVKRRSKATHPSIEDRIEALDPTFDRELGFTVLDADTVRAGVDEDSSDTAAGDVAGRDGSVADSFVVAAAAAAMSGEQSVDADDIVGTVGQASPEGLLYCASLIDEIPGVLMEARTRTVGAVAIAYLLLLDESREQRRRQAEVIEQDATASVRREAQRLWPEVRQLDDQLRLPLMDLLVPMLRRMTEQQYQKFSTIADRLVEVDEEATLRQFVLEKVLIHHLEVAFHDAGRKAVQFRSFSGVRRDLENVLSAVAYTADDDRAVVRKAFEQGREYLPNTIRGQLEFRPRQRWSFDQVGASLERLSLAAPRIKEALVDACAHSVMADDEVEVAEAEMLRAVCEIVDVPLPPIVAKQN